MSEPRIGVHYEPDCTDIHNGCFYPEPHKHGFACDRTCKECYGFCHPDCPEYTTSKREEMPPPPTPRVDICMCGHESYYHHKNTKACGVTGCKCRSYDHDTSAPA